MNPSFSGLIKKQRQQRVLSFGKGAEVKKTFYLLVKEPKAANGFIRW